MIKQELTKLTDSACVSPVPADPKNEGSEGHSAKRKRMRIKKPIDPSLRGNFLSAEEVAVFIGVTRHTIYQWIYDCSIEFPYYKFPRGVRFARKDVEKWLEGRKVAPVNSY